MRIIVIDEEQSFRDALKLHLEAQGHDVTAASEPALCDRYHGQACRAEQSCADVMLVDSHLSRMTGLEFLALLTPPDCQSHAAHKIIMSDSTRDIDLAGIHKVGCRVLQKPFSFELLDTILLQVRDQLESKPH